MEAKDTVMGDKELDKLTPEVSDVLGLRDTLTSETVLGWDELSPQQKMTSALTILLQRRTAQAQAEISFKAGQEVERQELNYCEKHKLYYCDCCPNCFEEKGIREVVKELNHYYIDGVPIGSRLSRLEGWQAKLKEWGVRICARCGAIRTDNIASDVCGSCADDLRADADAEILMTQASDEELARQEYEDAERRAYETDTGAD